MISKIYFLRQLRYNKYRKHPHVTQDWGIYADVEIVVDPGILVSMKYLSWMKLFGKISVVDCKMDYYEIFTWINIFFELGLAVALFPIKYSISSTICFSSSQNTLDMSKCKKWPAIRNIVSLILIDFVQIFSYSLPNALAIIVTDSQPAKIIWKTFSMENNKKRFWYFFILWFEFISQLN